MSDMWFMYMRNGKILQGFHYTVVRSDRADVAVEPVWDVGLPFPGVVDSGGERAGDGDLITPSSEHCCSIYRDKAHYEPVSGSGTTPRSSGIDAVVGTVGTKSRGDTGGGSGGGGE